MLALCLSLLLGLFAAGLKEGERAYTEGRYAVIDIDSGRVDAYLSRAALPAANAHKPVGKPVALSTSRSSTPVAEGDRLVPVPADALVETDEHGAVLPKIGEDGTKPWQYYARPFEPTADTSLISIVITGLGINRELSNAATALPSDISLSFSPYASNAPQWAQSARAQGHEVLLNLPLEPTNYPATDPGPQALLTHIMPDENTPRLRWTMAQMPGYIGMTIPADEVFFAGEQDFIKPIAAEFAGRGLLTLFSKRHERPALNAVLGATGLEYLYADVSIPYGVGGAEITRQLEALEAVAAERGHAIGVIEASPVAVEMLKKWQESVIQRGFKLAPISALARMKFS